MFFSTATRPMVMKIGLGKSSAAGSSGLNRSVSTPRVQKPSFLKPRAPSSCRSEAVATMVMAAACVKVPQHRIADAGRNAGADLDIFRKARGVGGGEGELVAAAIGRAPPSRSGLRSRYEWRRALPPRSVSRSRAGSAARSAGPDRSARPSTESRPGSGSRCRPRARRRCAPARSTCAPRRSPADAKHRSQSKSASREPESSADSQFPTFGQGYFRRMTSSKC